MTEAFPLVSVIIPTIGRLRYLEEALNSVRGQTYGNYEAIVAADGPMRGAERLVKRLLGGKSVFVRLPTRRGPAAARNAAIARARGDIIAFLDEDDVWHPRKLERQLKFMARTQTNFSYTDYEVVSESGKKILASWIGRPSAFVRHWKYLDFMERSEIMFEKLGFRQPYPKSSTVVLNRDSLKALGGSRPFDEKFRSFHEETDLWLRLCAVYGNGFLAFYDKEPLTRYRIHRKHLILKSSRGPVVLLDSAVFTMKQRMHFYCSPHSHLCLRDVWVKDEELSARRGCADLKEPRK